MKKIQVRWQVNFLIDDVLYKNIDKSVEDKYEYSILEHVEISLNWMILRRGSVELIKDLLQTSLRNEFIE